MAEPVYLAILQKICMKSKVKLADISYYTRDDMKWYVKDDQLRTVVVSNVNISSNGRSTTKVFGSFQNALSLNHTEHFLMVTTTNNYIVLKWSNFDRERSVSSLQSALLMKGKRKIKNCVQFIGKFLLL